MSVRLKDLTVVEQLVLAFSLVAVGILLIDPFLLEQARALPPGAREFFRSVTHIGRSNWILIPTGSAIALAIVLRRNHVGFRNSAAYGLIASTVGFVFVSVGGAGLIAALFKNILGRARPKLFDTVGQFEFQLFSFQPDYASIPSGHATTIFAFATVFAILWPRGRVLLYTVAVWIALSRVFIGMHYFTDVVLGAGLGTIFPYFVRDRFAARRWLFERTPDGGYRIRGARTTAWLGWPEPVRTVLHGPASVGGAGQNSEEIRGD
ncbi:MAG: phosphatase PAP2 family protein [Hyphomicrobiaceae bacterium]|jgi:membrane-associated phospholipid phosphatase|nr:phosphatase PAP2 family protein [Hyphomicrobiaceae bacterium]MDX2449123.1 phosphatase PAP2 family protein [Hyphomicrobiaceae bacterium]